MKSNSTTYVDTVSFDALLTIIEDEVLKMSATDVEKDLMALGIIPCKRYFVSNKHSDEKKIKNDKIASIEIYQRRRTHEKWKIFRATSGSHISDEPGYYQP